GEAPFADAADTVAEEQRREIETGDAEPMSAAHMESPFEQTGGYTSASLTVEKPLGIHIEPAPLAAELESPWDEEPKPPFASPEREPAHAADDLTTTLTIADLCTRHGLTADTRHTSTTIAHGPPGD